MINEKDICKLYSPDVYTLEWFDVLIQMYQPIIGAKATSIYLTLKFIADLDPHKISEMPIEDILCRMDLALSQFNSNLKYLEALNLIKTKVKRGSRKNTFTFQIFSPLSSTDFFKQDLLIHMLKEKVGSDILHLLFTKYLKPYINQSKLEDVSASFNDVFKKQSGSIEDTTAQVLTGFNTDFDIAELKNIMISSGVDTSILKDKELINTIKNSVILYDISILDVANVFNSTDSKKVTAKNFRKLLNDYLITKGNSEYNNVKQIQPAQFKVDTTNNEHEQVIERLEKMSPTKYFEFVMSRPAHMDELNLMENIMTQYKILPGVMNAIIDYIIIQKKNIQLHPSYITKIAASISKKSIVTVKQAIEYLISVNQEFDTPKSSSKVETQANKTSALDALKALEDL